MTVASLWKVLDTSGCGQAVGVTHFTGTNHHMNNARTAAATQKESLQGVNPWNYNNAKAARMQAHVNNNNIINNNNNNINNNNERCPLLPFAGGSSSNKCPQQQPLQQQKPKIKTLAVDLSIWICESLTSHAMSEHHANPSLHLVFARTVKLLSLGIGLVFVLEGKRRIRALGYGDQQPQQQPNPTTTGGQQHQHQQQANDKFHKRRSGTAFWKACRDCQEMLQLLGVPVVKAKAEGEALCALLNQRGIVDGVISNDGDCLLFGAKTVYTKFSIENLESGNIMRYDLDSLLAVCATASGDDDGDDDDGDENPNMGPNAEGPVASLTLSRTDLIAFALLTGSDLAGSGLSKVGHKKAIRFICKCQQDNPLQSSNAAIEELKSWARTTAATTTTTTTAAAAHVHGDGCGKVKATKCCTRCCHPGSKRSHEKHGCEICGTNPGEPCFMVTTEDRFRKSLRAKALAVQPKFEPSQVVQAYLRPNDNQIPAKLASVTSEHRLEMGTPDFTSLMQMSLIVKGRSLEGSREYIKQAVGRLLSRSELTCPVPASAATACNAQHTVKRLSRERPVPQKITKELTQKQVPCYEVSWKVNATITDDDGDGIDGYEYSTIEPRDLVQERYPALVKLFEQQEKERQKQGDGEKMRRQTFLQSLHVDANVASNPGGAYADDDHKNPPPSPVKRSKKREGFFAEQHQQQKSKRPRKEADKADEVPKPRQFKLAHVGQDVGHLLRFIANPVANAFRGVFDPFDHTTIQSQSDDEFLKVTKHHEKNMKRYNRNRRNRRELKKPPGYEHLPLPGGEDLVFCYMGDFEIEITPIRSVRPGEYPPRHIFLHHRLGVNPQELP